MPEGPSGTKREDGQRAREPWVARSSWVSQGLGERWVEVEPGIYEQNESDDLAVLASPEEAHSLEKPRRHASG
jgi:hypothetical protein